MAEHESELSPKGKLIEEIVSVVGTDSDDAVFGKIKQLVARFQEAEADDADESPTNDEYRDAAKSQYASDGSIEIDDDAIVARSSDPGAYVAAWVWVYRNTVPGHEDHEDDEDIASPPGAMGRIQ